MLFCRFRALRHAQLVPSSKQESSVKSAVVGCFCPQLSQYRVGLVFADLSWVDTESILHSPRVARCLAEEAVMRRKLMERINQSQSNHQQPHPVGEIATRRTTMAIVVIAVQTQSEIAHR